MSSVVRENLSALIAIYDQSDERWVDFSYYLGRIIKQRALVSSQIYSITRRIKYYKTSSSLPAVRCMKLISSSSSSLSDLSASLTSEMVDDCRVDA
jgi:hypothetical protein